MPEAFVLPEDKIVLVLRNHGPQVGILMIGVRNTLVQLKLCWINWLGHPQPPCSHI